MDFQIRGSKTSLEKLVATARSGTSWKSYPSLLEFKRVNSFGIEFSKYILPLSDNLSLWIYDYSRKDNYKYSMCIFGTQNDRNQVLEQRIEQPFYDSTISIRQILNVIWETGKICQTATAEDVQNTINWAIFTYAGCDAYEICYLGLTKIKAQRPQIKEQ